MKTIKYYMLFAVCLLTTGLFTSCDSSDDNELEARNLTDAEKTLYKQAINGSYSGYVVYWLSDDFKTEFEEKSQSASWVVNANDKQLIVSNFPLQTIADVTRNLDLKELLEKAGPVKMTAKVEPVDPEYVQYIEQSYYRYYITPESMKFTVDGKEITINFWTAMNYLGVRYESVATVYNKAFTLPVLIRDIQVDYTNYEINELMYLTNSYTPKTTEK